MTSLVLRPYQAKALDDIRALYGKGTKRALLHLATGGGKTLIFSQVMKGVHERGKRAILLVKGVELIDQASQRLFREGVPHGVMQGKHWNYRPFERVQVCSVDTLWARRKKQELPHADLVVIDEAHMATSPTFRWVLEQYANAFFLPVSATPHVREGLRHVADAVVYPIGIGELITQGFLCKPRYFAPPTGIDLEALKIDRKTGDYDIAQLAEACAETKLLGNIVAHYKSHALGRATVCFAVNVAHSISIVERFKAEGIRAVHVDADTPAVARKDILRDLELRKVDVVSNVGILCTGVDMPCVSAIIMARPTKSYNLYIQQAGRGTRIYPGKSDFLVLDHAGNVEQHGFIEFEKPCSLDGKEDSVARRIPLTTCRVCYNVFDPSAQWSELNPELADAGKTGRDYICRAIVGEDQICETDNTPQRSAREAKEIETADDVRLREITDPELYRRLQVEAWVEEKLNRCLTRGYKPGWLFYQIRDRFGEVEANEQMARLAPRLPQANSRRPAG